MPKQLIISSIVCGFLFAACSNEIDADILGDGTWDEMRCANEGGLLVEGNPLKCRITVQNDDGEIETKEVMIGEENMDGLAQKYEPKLFNFLQKSNLPIENIWMIETPVMGKEGAVVLMNGKYVQMYMFESDNEAYEVNKLLKEGQSLPNGTKIEWGEDAVFFHLGSTVAVANGENTNVFIDKDIE